MKQIFKHTLLIVGTASVMLSTTSCKKNYSNPNAATSDQVFSSTTGLTGVAVSLQRTYALTRAGSIYNIVTANGFTTNELILLNAGNTAEYQLSVGGGTVGGERVAIKSKQQLVHLRNVPAAGYQGEVLAGLGRAGDGHRGVRRRAVTRGGGAHIPGGVEQVEAVVAATVSC